MTKYKIILHDYTLRGYLTKHKKSGMSYWCLYNSMNVYGEDITFNSSYAAKCFLLSMSRFPKFDMYLISSFPDEAVIDKMLAKGSYTLKDTYNNRLPKESQSSLLCEFVIVEVEDV